MNLLNIENMKIDKIYITIYVSVSRSVVDKLQLSNYIIFLEGLHMLFKQSHASLKVTLILKLKGMDGVHQLQTLKAQAHPHLNLPLNYPHPH